MVRYTGEYTEANLSIVRDLNPGLKDVHNIVPGQVLTLPDRRPGFYEPTVIEIGRSGSRAAASRPGWKSAGDSSTPLEADPHIFLRRG